MKRSHSRKPRATRVRCRLTYLEDLDDTKGEEGEEEMKVQCDEDENHVAALYCLKCEANLCKVCSDDIHSRKVLSGHQIVPLAEKPEPPIKCTLHQLEIAKLICKEESCDGLNKPMCYICHQYEKHKGHKYEILDNEFDKLRKDVGICMKEIERKRATCDKNVKNYDKCISTYSSTGTLFMQTERDKIEKLYAEAKSTALKKIGDFAQSRIEVLELKKNQFIDDKTKLDNMKTAIQKTEKMRKMELIENGDTVRRLIEEAGEKLDEPTNLIPAKCFKVKYPDFESISVEMEIDHEEISKFLRLQKQKTIPVVLFYECGFGVMNFDSLTDWAKDSKSILSYEEADKGILYHYEDGRSVLGFKKNPDDKTIDLSKYKYTLVIMFPREDKDEDVKQLKEQMTKYWWSRIVVVMKDYDLESMTEFAVKLRVIAGTDKRVVFRKFKDIVQEV